MTLTSPSSCNLPATYLPTLPASPASHPACLQRLAGKRVRFVTGTDEHGEKIALAAAARGMAPQEHCDNIVEAYKELWSRLDISYDSFIRTTDAKHVALVEEVLKRVWDKVGKEGKGNEVFKGVWGVLCPLNEP
jgi:hypothetical protein